MKLRGKWSFTRSTPLYVFYVTINDVLMLDIQGYIDMVLDDCHGQGFIINASNEHVMLCKAVKLQSPELTSYMRPYLK